MITPGVTTWCVVVCVWVGVYVCVWKRGVCLVRERGGKAQDGGGVTCVTCRKVTMTTKWRDSYLVVKGTGSYQYDQRQRGRLFVSAITDGAWSQDLTSVTRDKGRKLFVWSVTIVTTKYRLRCAVTHSGNFKLYTKCVYMRVWLGRERERKRKWSLWSWKHWEPLGAYGEGLRAYFYHLRDVMVISTCVLDFGQCWHVGMLFGFKFYRALLCAEWGS